MIVRTILFALALLVAMRVMAAPDARLAMRLISMPGSDVISAYEPVVMLLETTNLSAAAVSLSAWTTQHTMQIDIRDGQGKEVAGLPKLPIPLDFMHAVYRLKPGETLESVLIISALYTFSTPGIYTIELQQFDTEREHPNVLAMAQAKVTVQPFDAARLLARIDRIREGTRTTELLSQSVKTFYTLRHNLAIPVLAARVRQSGDVYAARALRRLGTPEAMQQLEALEAEGEKASKAVRDAAGEMQPANTWDLTGEDARVLPAPPPPAPSPPPSLKEPALALIDVPGNRTLFTLNDIVRFDWDKQVFQLTRERAMDLLALRVLTREFRLVAGAETVYRGAFYSPISSNLPGGPIITLGTMSDEIVKVKPPLFQLEMSRFAGEADLRFSPRLRDILAKAEILGAIDPVRVPPITSMNTGWHWEPELNVRAVIFPETFTSKTPACLHLWFARDQDRPLPKTVEILATMEDKDYHRWVTRISDLPLLQIVETGDAYILKLSGWATAEGEPFTPGPVRLLVQIRAFREEEVAGQRQTAMTHQILFPWMQVDVP